jgi:hypothetical protein
LPTGFAVVSHRTDVSDYFEPGLVEILDEDLASAGRKTPSDGFVFAHPAPLLADPAPSQKLACAPHWFLATVFALPPIGALALKLVRRRTKGGHCAA